MVDKPSDVKGLVDGNAVVHERKRSAEKGVVDVCFVMNFFLRNKLCRRFRRTKKGTTTTYNINNRATMMPASSRTRRGYACEPRYFQTVPLPIIASYARAEWATKQRKFLLLTNERSLNARPAYLGEARREPGRNYIVFASKRPSRQLAGCFYVRQSRVLRQKSFALGIPMLLLDTLWLSCISNCFFSLYSTL